MEPILYKIAKPIITILFKILYRPTIVGKENIPKKGRIVLAGNHTNNFDCLLLISSTKRCIHFLAKAELMKGSKKIIFKNMGIIPVNRKIKDKKSLQTAIETLNHDKTIGIFPEGTINRTNDIIMPFKIGAVKMAYETNALIVPFSITGKYKLFNNKLKIIFGEPFKITDSNLDNENKKLMDKVSDLILKGNENGKNN